MTPDGSQRYPIVDGIPILLVREHSLFDSADYTNDRAVSSWSGRMLGRLKEAIRTGLHRPPTLSRSVSTKRNYAHLQRLLRGKIISSDRAVRLLVVGGATVGTGAAEILNTAGLEVIETDIVLSERTVVICDGHDLPFADGSFDAVICQAVLEHVLDPQRVADEIWRVLRPEGFIYSEIPFMQQVHMGAFDFTRFTQLGHRRLWRRFDELRSGAQGGPGMALIWSVAYFVRAFVPSVMWPVVDRCVSLGFFWLKYFDDYLVTKPGGIDAASGTFFLGARRDTPIDDRAIVRGYLGGGRMRLTS